MHFIDSHTGGEPTRVILEGGPDLGTGSLAERAVRFAAEANAFRTAVILEPRGSNAWVGALLCKPGDASCSAAAIFFNNAGTLGMCGHGTMGLVVTLAYLGQLEKGRHRIETPVGVVVAELVSPNEVAVENVASYLYRANVRVDVPGMGAVTGDIAWGGNWFFLVEGAPAPLTLQNERVLTQSAEQVMQALRDQGITGVGGADINHIEFFGPPESSDADSRNFVLCPGGAYDRSPCGTGTSAKVACLAASGKLDPGQSWVQESVIGSRFTATYRRGANGEIIPTIRGRAFVCSEGALIQQDGDPYRAGIL